MLRDFNMLEKNARLHYALIIVIDSYIDFYKSLSKSLNTLRFYASLMCFECGWISGALEDRSGCFTHEE